MAQSKGKGRGFGSMDEQRQREISRLGGRASAQSDTSNRGFASMDKEKQRAISRMGGKASHSSARTENKQNDTRPQPGSDQEVLNRANLTETSDHDERILNSLEEEEEEQMRRSGLSYSETDEDEDEGLGDGRMGRSEPSRGLRDEG